MNQQYKERVKLQTLKWAQGQPYHNRIDNESGNTIMSIMETKINAPE